MAEPTKARLSDETFDAFLAEEGLLDQCESAALTEIAEDTDKLVPQPASESP